MGAHMDTQARWNDDVLMMYRGGRFRGYSLVDHVGHDDGMVDHEL